MASPNGVSPRHSMPVGEGESLEASLKAMIAQQQTMIEELRAQNQADLEKNKAMLRDEILGALRPMMMEAAQQSPGPAGGAATAASSGANAGPTLATRYLREILLRF